MAMRRIVLGLAAVVLAGVAGTQGRWHSRPRPSSPPGR